MKDLLKKLLQSVLGFSNYLYVFSLFKILTLRSDKKENDFFHFLGMIPDDGIILDIGANIGIMTVHFCKHKPGSIVHCFEPIRENFRTLQRVIRFFGLRNVSLHQLALGNADGTIKMVMPVINNVKMQGLSYVSEEPVTEGGIMYSVSLKKLDDVIGTGETSKPVRAIKIDVENYEGQVLAGARKVIENFRPLIYCELWNNENRESCLSFIKGYNYKVMVLKENMLEEFNASVHKTQNFFFLPS
jgi:FkbM family methyltransferase